MDLTGSGADAWVRKNHDWFTWASNNIVFNLDIITCKLRRTNSRAPLFPWARFLRGSLIKCFL